MYLKLQGMMPAPAIHVYHGRLPGEFPQLYHVEINMNPFSMVKGNSGGMYVFLFYKVPVPPGFVVDQSGLNTGPVPEFIWIMRNLLKALGKNLGYKAIKNQTTREFEKNIRPATPTPKTIGSIFRDTRFTGNIASFAFAVATGDLPQTLDQILAEIAINAFAGAAAVRFVKGTKATLGFTRFEHTCVVEMDGLDIEGNHQVFANVIDRLNNNGIPCTIHWGKLNDPLNASNVIAMYGADKVKSWKHARETLLLPEARAVFTNDFMKKCGLDTAFL